MRDTGDETIRVRIEAEGAVLAGTLRRPPGPARVAVVIHAATGVPARFYDAFATWLAETRDAAVLTYDYRDFGASGPARGGAATMADWAVRDQQAARDLLAREVPGVPLWVIGHSLGTLGLPFQTGLDGIARVIAVASGPVHVSDHPWPYQGLARAFWTPGLVALSRRLGYLPARALRLGHDLPAGVYAQWRRWCMTRGFYLADPAMPAPDASALTCPLRVVAVADDPVCPPAAAWRLMALYPEARKRQRVIRPEAVGMARIGHLDVLAARGRPCWEAVVAE